MQITSHPLRSGRSTSPLRVASILTINATTAIKSPRSSSSLTTSRVTPAADSGAYKWKGKCFCCKVLPHFEAMTVKPATA